MPSFLYRRGVYVTDKITGFKGCITARMDGITGCNRYYIQPRIDKDGKRPDAWWIDEHCLEVDTSEQRLDLYRTQEQPPG